MKRRFRIVCRGSKLSLAQAAIFERRLLANNPLLDIELIIKETRGDAIQDIPLQDIEGIDFFTRDIQDYLLSGQADFAVHSLKDVSGENFFKNTCYGIIERDDPHDVVVFNESVFQKLKKGDVIVVGTSSPRRANMATGFLRLALPVLNGKLVAIAAESIRGNVDTRLRKLDEGQYDGIILAFAGLNRLLNQESGGDDIGQLLANKRLMILPLLQCPPAAGQGAIVAETVPGNDAAIAALRAINDPAIANAVNQERKIAHRYGSGCHQEFGVVHITGNEDFIFAAGKDRNGKSFVEHFSMNGVAIPSGHSEGKREQADPKHSLFGGKNIDLINSSKLPIVSDKRMWVTQTDLWFDLAKKGWWVQGSLEGFGLHFIEKTLTSPLVSLGSNSTVTLQ